MLGNDPRSKYYFTPGAGVLEVIKCRAADAKIEADRYSDEEEMRELRNTISETTRDNQNV
jgi:hypothetical protein